MCLLMPRGEATAVPAFDDRARRGMRSTPRGTPQRCETAGDGKTLLYRDRTQVTVTRITGSEELRRAMTSNSSLSQRIRRRPVASVAMRSVSEQCSGVARCVQNKNVPNQSVRIEVV